MTSTIRIGTRASDLAVAQAKIVQQAIEDNFDYHTEIKMIESQADIDLVSKLTSFRGQGIFTSHLETALLDNEIDVAVHSLKDLPVEVPSELPLRVYLKRHSVGDSLIIKSNKVITRNPLVLSEKIRFATGSPRRQSQFMEQFPSAIPVDIRGNVGTRLSRLSANYIDGLLMATAVFDRIELPLSEGVERIELDTEYFIPAPGQAVIAVQCRQDEYLDLEYLDDKDSRIAAKNERDLLLKMGGGCDISFGAHIFKENEKWVLHTSHAPMGWYPGMPADLSRFRGSHENIKKLIESYSETIVIPPLIEPTEHLAGKRIIIFRSPKDAQPYKTVLKNHGAVVMSMPVLEYQVKWNMIDDTELLDAWESTKWLVVSSQRAVPFIDVLVSTTDHPHMIAAVGKKTASALRSYGLQVNLVASGSMGDLSQQLDDALEHFPGDVIYLHGENYYSYPDKVKHGFPVYQVTTKNLSKPLKVDYCIVFSSRSAETVFSQIGHEYSDNWIAIGPTTGSSIEKTVKNSFTANIPSPQGVLETILEVSRDA